MTGPQHPPPARTAVGLAAAAGVVAGAGLVRELTGAGIGALRPAFVALGGLAAVACLFVARRETGALAWMFAALGATLAVCAAAALA
ncbi:MAG: hypothetical protein QOH11_537 [Solirubrobacteraceae bacterium]|jgi:hypothetical protein|nr:hypothetical protein [Solirubrobacteraceae bacterium]